MCLFYFAFFEKLLDKETMLLLIHTRHCFREKQHSVTSTKTAAGLKALASRVHAHIFANNARKLDRNDKKNVSHKYFLLFCHFRKKNKCVIHLLSSCPYHHGQFATLVKYGSIIKHLHELLNSSIAHFTAVNDETVGGRPGIALQTLLR